MPDPGSLSAGPGDARLRAALSQLQVIAGAFASSVLVYCGVGWFVTTGGGSGGYEPNGLPTAFVAVLAALALFDLIIAPVIEHALGSGAQAEAASQGPDRAIADYRRAKLVGFAFREAAAVLGLLISLFTGNPTWCYVLAAATLVAMGLAWPSRDGLLKAIGGSVQPR